MPPPLRAAGPRRHGVTIPRASPQASPAAPPRVPGTPLAADGADPPLLQRALSALFTLPPILSAAAGRARETIRQRGLSVGVDVVAEAEALARAADWASVKASVENAGVRYPPYYLAPFHCYPEGNLNWDAAFQAYAAAAAVHATVMSPPGLSPPIPSRDGDASLRASFSEAARCLLADAGVDPDSTIRTALDLGCSVGLSTAEVRRAFPNVKEVTGVDLSPHMLAVAVHTAADPVPRFLHAAAEETGLEAGSFDLVSMCLVAHECPAAATAAIFAEAFRLLRPGGILAGMDMDSGSSAFASIVVNPAAFAGFSASEPHLSSYMTLDPVAAARAAGFGWVKTTANSPRHYTLVAVKK